ncbi:MAG: InlB B-repeat-containing protein, partial [Solirubrobacterales bacterium]
MNGRTFSPGDRILFNRGQVWREQLVVPSSGVSGNPITFGAYGSGSRPAIKGSALPGGWTNSGGSVWRASLSSTPNQVFFSGVRGTKVSGTSSVNSANKWYWSGGVLYVYAASNPGSTIEASVRPSTRSYGLVHITGREYVNIESLAVTQSASFGLYIKPAAQYITVRDCEVSYSLDGGLVAPSSNGVGCSQLTIEDCLVHHNNTGYIGGGVPGTDTYHEGLTMERVNGFVIRRTKVYDNYMEGSNFKRGATNGLIEYCDLYSNDLINQYIEGATNIEIRYNRIYDCSYNAGIEFGMETDTYNNDNVRIHHNLFWNNSGGVSFWAGNFTGQHRNIKIENNTFYNNWEAIRWKSGATDNYSGTNYIRDNLFWQNGASNRAIWDYTSGSQAISRTTIAYNAFQQGAATATTGSNAKVITDPYFTAASSSNFSLRSGSPCINAGASLGWTTDIVGTSIPQGGTPDIGAYEYASGGTPTPTSYTLSVSATNGTVTKTPNQTSYTAGTTVTLQATPNSGYTFTGWSGSLSGTTNPATITMDANKSVTANFTVSGNTGGGSTTTKTVGNTTVFSGVATAMNRRAVPYTMSEAGQLRSLSIYHNGGSGQMLLAVYSDSSSRPGTRLGVTNAVTVNPSAGWQTVALQSPV